MEQTVLLTGFGPFPNHPVNVSWEIVKEIKSLWSNANFNLEIREIPVVYSTVTSYVPKLYDELRPALCVHFGVNGYTPIKLESHGRNEGYIYADVTGKTPPGNVCLPGGPSSLETTVDLDSVCDRYRKVETEVEIKTSSDADLYLCEFIYYMSLSQERAPVLFVHVPPLDGPYPGYSLQQLAVACKRIVEILVEDVCLQRALS